MFRVRLTRRYGIRGVLHANVLRLTERQGFNEPGVGLYRAIASNHFCCRTCDLLPRRAIDVTHALRCTSVPDTPLTLATKDVSGS